MTTADWDAIKYANKILIISFACFATANLHYGLFGELLESFSLLLICNKPKDLAIGTNYGRYGKLIAGPHPICDFNLYDGGAEDDNDGGGKDQNDDWGERDDKKSDGDYAGREGEPASLDTLGRLSPLNTSKRPSPLDILRKGLFWIIFSPWCTSAHRL